MGATVSPTTAVLTPDPVAVCAHINRLNRELRIAKRLLRVTLEARQPVVEQSPPPAGKVEGAHVSR